MSQVGSRRSKGAHRRVTSWRPPCDSQTPTVCPGWTSSLLLAEPRVTCLSFPVPPHCPFPSPLGSPLSPPSPSHLCVARKSLLELGTVTCRDDSLGPELAWTSVSAPRKAGLTWDQEQAGRQECRRRRQSGAWSTSPGPGPLSPRKLCHPLVSQAGQPAHLGQVSL